LTTSPLSILRRLRPNAGIIQIQSIRFVSYAKANSLNLNNPAFGHNFHKCQLRAAI